MKQKSSLVLKTELDFNDIHLISEREKIKRRMSYDKKRDYNWTSVENDIVNETLDLGGYLVLKEIEPNTGKNILNNKIKFFDKYFNNLNVKYKFKPIPKKLKLKIEASIEGYLFSDMGIDEMIDLDKINTFIRLGNYSKSE